MKNAEKNVVLNESIERFILERIKENKELFTDKELEFIRDNTIITKKIYLLGAINFNKI